MMYEDEEECKEGEAISLIATASKLAAVEDVGPKRPEGQTRPSVTSLKVSPTARATLQALRTNRNRISSATTPPCTKDAETITGMRGKISSIRFFWFKSKQLRFYRNWQRSRMAAGLASIFFDSS
ncbi:uncharacterized protein LOC124947996 isoform X2 [Vespa velutina]|uniref:uncharacterized protein LOC124947996 isoform X2 n=1 Tax=Vespa velutina TaxID=202808 RepID=UPI001FB32C85|nr:uncharacterized protein LOC124947996 isoform X2 [Vespa velutina]